MKKHERVISIILSVLITFMSFPTRVFAEDLNKSISENTEVSDNKKTDEKAEPKIIAEIKEKRGEYTKTFLREDMTYQAVIYQEPVHYLVNEKWEDIDNSMDEIDGTADSEALEEVNEDSSINSNTNTSSKVEENSVADPNSQTEAKDKVADSKEQTSASNSKNSANAKPKDEKPSTQTELKDKVTDTKEQTLAVDSKDAASAKPKDEKSSAQTEVKDKVTDAKGQISASNSKDAANAKPKDEKPSAQTEVKDKVTDTKEQTPANSLNSKKTDNKSNVFENKKNEFKIDISKKSTAKKLVTIKKDKYEVQWNIQDVNKVESSVRTIDEKKIQSDIEAAVDKELSKESNSTNKAENRKIKIENEKKKVLPNTSSSVDFKGIFDNIDLQYNTVGNKVKENIIINKPTDKTEFTFNLNIKNLIPKLQKDNSIIFYDSKQTDKVIFTMKAPFMYDSKLVTSDKIKMNLSETKKGYTLTLSADKEWINCADRAYPITIDPDVQTSQNVKDIKDTFVASNDTQDKYNNIFIRVGQNADVGTTRSYLKFKLPTISSADMVIYAQLNLTALSQNVGSGVSQINAYEVTSSWGGTTAEGLKWSNQPSSSNVISDYAMVDRSYSGWKSWSITDIVKRWYTTGNNNGLMLKANNEGCGDVAFLSSDCGDDYTGNRPFISITYINNSGLESYWTYHSQAAKRAGTGYINDYNGNLIFEHDDLNTGGDKLPVAIKHVYNSNDKEHHGFGLGWRLNYSQRFEYKNIDGKGYYVYTDEDGTKHYFKASSDKEIKDELNLGLTLIIEGNNTYTIKDKKDNKVNFWSSGEIRYITDNKGNCINFTYGTAANGAKVLTALTEEGSGRTTKLNYYSYGSVQEIVDPAGRKTSFEYDSAGNLYKITYPDGNHSTYTYDASHNLTSAINYDGYKINYSYYNTEVYRVKKALETGTDGTLGGELNISYGNNSTSFTDFKGRTDSYYFDYWGKTLSIKDSEGNAKFYEYNKQDNSNITKIGEESKLQKTIINYVKNHNAETDYAWYGYSNGSNTGTQGYTSEDKYLGSRSIKITNTNGLNGSYFEQGGISLERGKTYTLSTYIKTKDISSKDNAGACFYVGYTDAAGSCIFAKKFIDGTKDWDKYELNFTLPSDAKSNTVWIGLSILDNTGTAYFDCVQLEEGAVSNRYNLIENSSFIYGGSIPDLWKDNGQLDSGDTAVTSEAAPCSKISGDRSFKFSGSATKQKGLWQWINVPGDANKAVMFGGWIKGLSVPTGNGRTFAISIAFHHADDSNEWFGIDIPGSSIDWQYVSKKVVPKSNYDKILINVFYSNNANDSYFDGMQVYKDEYGTSYQYDANGNVVSTADLANQNSKFEYNGTNDLIASTDPKGNKFKYDYDAKHNLTKATTAENVVYSFTYDDKGNPTTARVGDSSLFIQSSATYTPSGNYVKTMTDAFGNTTTYNHDEDKDTLTSVEDSSGKTSYEYDPQLDRLKSVSKMVDREVRVWDGKIEDNSGEIVNNTYNYENDKIKTISANNGVSYNFGYDSLGNNTSVAVGNQNLITNNYEARTSKLLSSTYGNTQTVESIYDVMERVTSRKANGVELFQYKYDANGNLAYHKDIVNGTDYRYIYDLAERISKIKDASGNIISYEYDNNNNLSKLTDKINNVTFVTNYSYDKDNRSSTINYTRNANNTLTNTYDTLGRLTNKNINTGTTNLTTTYLYHPGALINSTSAKVQTVINNNNKINYEYEPNGNIKAITQNNNKVEYEYNELSELKKENNPVINKTILYGYDAGGNIIRKTEYPYTTGTLGTPLRNIEYTYGDSNWKDKLTSYDGKEITYDQIGNPLSYDNYKFAWQQGRQLKSINGNGKSVSFKYNDAGIRTEKNVNGVTTKYHLVGDKVTFESSGSSNVCNTYKYDYSQNKQWTYHGFEIPVDTSKKYIYSFDAYISSDANIAATGATFIADAEDGFKGGLYYDNSKKGTWQHFESEQVPTSKNARLLLYPSTDIIPATTGYIMYKNVQFKEVNTNNNLFEQPLMDNQFGAKGNGVFECINNAEKAQAYNTYKYDYSQNKQWTYHGFEIPVSTSKKYIYSFDAYISSDANIAATGATFIADAEDGFKGGLYYDNTKKGTWQHFESEQVPTSKNARLLLYPSTDIIPATTGYIMYKNIQFREIGTSNNLFEQVSSDNEFAVRGSGTFECSKDDNIQVNNTFKYDYSQNAPYTYHGFDIPVNTGKSYTYSFDAYISQDANMGTSGETYIANGENGFVINFGYDNTKKGTWQHFETTQVPTAGVARILLYPSTGTSPATTGYIMYRNVQFKEVGTSNNLFGQPLIIDGGFTVKGNGVFECSYNNDSTSIYYTYDSSAHLVSMNLNGVEYYYIRNAQGDIIGLYDKNGTQVVSYTYDTWGKLISIDGSLKDSVGVKNPYRYRGYRYDSETGLYYLQSRYYNPEWGRFINADGIVGQTGELLGHNLYAYTKNNPVNMSDESGFRPIYTVGEETDEMVAASAAVMAKASSSGSADTSIIKKAFNAYKEYSNEAYKGMIATITLSVAIIGKSAADRFINSSINKYSNKLLSGSRNQSFRAAKRSAGIPVSAQPITHKFVYDGENRIVHQFEVDGINKYIIEHRWDKFGRGPHFHGADDTIGSPFQKGRYQQYNGHFPEDFGGYTK